VRIDASEAGELGMEFFEFHVASDALIVIFEDGEAEDCIEDYDDCGPLVVPRSDCCGNS